MLKPLKFPSGVDGVELRDGLPDRERATDKTVTADLNIWLNTFFLISPLFGGRIWCGLFFGLYAQVNSISFEMKT